MNKAIFNPCHKVNIDMFRSGKKIYEFKPKGTVNWEKGMKIYFDETGTGGCRKVVMEAIIENRFILEMGNDYIDNLVYANDLLNIDYEKYEMIDIRNLQEIGYTNQKYAYKLKDIKFYDEPKELNEFHLYNIRKNCEHHEYEGNGGKWYCLIDSHNTYSFCLGFECPLNVLKRCPQSFCYVCELDDDNA